MLTALGIILFFIGLIISIALHEAGHLIFAKLFGARVTQYMVGFGSTVFSRTCGDTEYGLKILPLGGYVRIIGMSPPAKATAPGAKARPARGPAGAAARMIESFRASDRKQVTEADDGREFYQLHPAKRIIVMFAGPFANIMIALGLFGIILLGIGLPTLVPTVRTVSQCVLPSSTAATVCPAGATLAPAAAAGLLPGDKIISFNGQSVTSWDQLGTLIRPAAGQTVPLTYRRGDQEIQTQIAIVSNQLPIIDSDGNITGTHTAGFMGITAATEYQTQTVGAAFSLAGQFITQGGKAILAVPQRIPALWESIFNGKPRDVNSPVGIVGAGRFGGQILSSDTNAKDKWLLFLQLLAGFNMSLFLLNLLPLLPLDGGHILGAAIEWVRRGWARVRRKGVPAPFDVAKLMPIAYGVTLIFVAISVLTLLADIINPVKFI